MSFLERDFFIKRVFQILIRGKVTNQNHKQVMLQNVS